MTVLVWRRKMLKADKNEIHAHKGVIHNRARNKKF